MFITVLKGLYQLILAVPSLLSVFQSIMKVIHEEQDYQLRKERAQELAKAMKSANESKDTSSLEQIFNPKPKP